MLDYCFCHHCSNICWSLTCWTVCSMSRSWDGPVRGGFAAGDLVAGLCCPLPWKLQPPPLQPYLQGCVRPPAIAGAHPDMHPKQKIGSSCVRLPAIAGAHPDTHNKKQKAVRTTRHGSLPDVLFCGSAISACDSVRVLPSARSTPLLSALVKSMNNGSMQ